MFCDSDFNWYWCLLPIFTHSHKGVWKPCEKLLFCYEKRKDPAIHKQIMWAVRGCAFLLYHVLNYWRISIRITQHLGEIDVLFVVKILGKLASHWYYMHKQGVAQGSIMGPMTYSWQIIPKEVKTESKIWNMLPKIWILSSAEYCSTDYKQ